MDDGPTLVPVAFYDPIEWPTAILPAPVRTAAPAKPESPMGNVRPLVAMAAFAVAFEVVSVAAVLGAVAATILASLP